MKSPLLSQKWLCSGNDLTLNGVTPVAGFARKLSRGGCNPPIPALSFSGAKNALSGVKLRI